MRDRLWATLVVLAMLAAPASAQDKSSSLDDVKMSFTFRSGEAFDINQLLQSWGVALGQVVIADGQLKGQRLNLLTQTTEMSWLVFKKILAMNSIIIVEDEIAPGQYLIKAHMQRNLQANESPPYKFIKSGEGLPGGSQIITAVIQIKNGAGREIFSTVRGLLTRDRNRIGEILYVQGPEVIIVVDFARNVKYYQSIIGALDIQAPGQEIRVRKLDFALPSELSQVLSQLFQAAAPANRPIGFQVAAGTQVAQPQIIAHDPTQKLIMRAYSYQFAEIDRLIGELDVRIREETGKFHVYKCQSAEADDLATKLQDLFSRQRSRSQNRPSAGGGARPVRAGAGGASGSVGQTGGGTQVQTRIVADQRTNSLLIQAEDEEYQAIRRLLRQLDRKRRRVFIEAQIWEITARDDLTISTELAALAQPHQGSFRPLSGTSFGLSDLSFDGNSGQLRRDIIPRLNSGLTAVLTKDSFNRLPVIINLMQSYNQSRKITTPFAITNDNGKATFKVTNREPFNTTTVNNVASQQNVQFVEATSTLTIEPQVNSNDNLTLDLELLISSFGARPSIDLPPSTNSREYRGRVTVPNGKYIVFGGLDSESLAYVESKVPFLGDIPILGHLFKQWLRNKSKTKVYVFIRPVIFYDERFRDDIRASDALHKRAHTESEREEWLPPIVPDENYKRGKSLQDKLFETFGTGSANPFG